MPNKELSGSRKKIEQQLSVLDGQIADASKRLETLYDALETGKVELDQLAPRIRQLTERSEKLKRERVNLKLSAQSETVQLGKSQVREYVGDLRSLLTESSIAEQRSFLKSFVKRIEVGESQLTLDYTLPLMNEKCRKGGREVLPFAQTNSPYRTILELIGP